MCNRKSITEETGVTIDIDDDGTVRVYAPNSESLALAQGEVELDLLAGGEARPRPGGDGGHDGVIAFGGGSGLDLGKMLAFMCGQTRPVWDFEDVGDNFAEEARRLHYGESEPRNIRGETTPAEEKDLQSEGVAFLKVAIPKPTN